MFEFLLAGITFAGLLIATFTDLKERIVPDWVSYGMLLLGLAIHGIWAFVLGDVWVFGTTLCVTIATFLLALFFWKIGFWAGGDVKLFSAIAALNPFNFAVIRSFLGLNFFAVTNMPVFPAEVFVFSVFAVFPIGLLMAVKNINQDKELKEHVLSDFGKGLKKNVFFSIGIAGLWSVFSFFSINFLIGIALSAIIVFLARKFFFKAAMAVFFVIGIMLSMQTFYDALFFFVVSVFLMVLLKLLSLSRSGALSKKVKISELKEGMIAGITLVEVNGKISEWKPSIKSILKNLKNNNVDGIKEAFRPNGRIIVSGTAADGLAMEQISELEKLAEKGIISSIFPVKESTAFVPAIFAAYVFLQVFGDVLWSIFL